MRIRTENGLSSLGLGPGPPSSVNGGGQQHLGGWSKIQDNSFLYDYDPSSSVRVFDKGQQEVKVSEEPSLMNTVEIVTKVLACRMQRILLVIPSL